METVILAECGLVCNLCSAFVREKNRCSGCQGEGYVLPHCRKCGIVLCPVKQEIPGLICADCERFPCRRLKDLEKRYLSKYGVSLLENFALLKAGGKVGLHEAIRKKWACTSCGSMLIVHQPSCPACGSLNPHYPNTLES